MNEDIAKKKQHSTRELVAGGSIFVLGLPLIVFAVVMSLVALIASIGFSAEIGLVLIAVYGSLLAAMIFLSWRVIRRSGKLVRRIQGLRRERQRTANLAERDMSRLELSESEIDTATLPDEELRQMQRRGK